MEWVEKTGKTVAEATERALDQLGVSEHDAELVVLAEPRTGLFGRTRGEARVRARVRPAEPRPKRGRQRDRARGGGAGSRSGSGRPSRAGDGPTEPTSAEDRVSDGRGSAAKEKGAAAPSSASRRRRRRRRRTSRAEGGQSGSPQAREGHAGADSAAADRADRRKTANGNGAEKEGQAVADGITLQEQAEVAKEFLEGLLDRYGLEATIDVRELDDETVELAAHGEGLGVLVGPKGATIAALQDVTRTVVQRHFPNRTDRILVDVAGYRERRAAALRRFTAEVAADVLESGTERALEPMSPADRKVVHDTALTIDGVTSSSRGEEPNRFVVISPAS